MTTMEITKRIERRKIFGSTAVLLPYTRTGVIDWEGFGGHLERTARTGLVPALNMDTGFGPQLSAGERREVLAFARRTIGEGPLIAGAGAFGEEADPLGAYRASVAEIVEVGAEPIVFQSPWLTAKGGAELARAYGEILAGVERGYAFELGKMFAPFGKIYALEEYARLLELPNLVGAKHSSLSRLPEWERLALRDRVRPKFRVLTGNDLAIDLVMYGSDYLLGLSTFDPEAFALRDRWWAQGDVRFYELNDALQALGAVAFREPVPAYKHSAAVYLHLRGMLKEPAVHPACPLRPTWEGELLRPLLEQVERAKAA